MLVHRTWGAGQPGWGRGRGHPPLKVAFAERGRALGGSSGRGAGRGRRAVALGPVGRQGRGGARRGRCSELREPSGRSRMAAAAGEARRVLVYGGRGALGSRCVQAFRARNWVANWAGGSGGSAPRAGLGGGRARWGAWEPSGASREGSLGESGGPCAPPDMGACRYMHKSTHLFQFPSTCSRRP